MELNELVGGVKLVADVISSPNPDAEKVKTVVKAVALAYCKLLPKVNPKLSEMPLTERYVMCGTAAMATVTMLRSGYQAMAGEITVEEGAERVTKSIELFIASIPEQVEVLGNAHPVLKTVAKVMAPVCKVLAPKVAEKIRPHAKQIIASAKSAYSKAVSVAKSFFAKVKQRVMG